MTNPEGSTPSVRRVEFYFRETAAGIRRNGTVAFGAVSTAFIALFLFGLALLIRREISLVIEQITGNVQVAVYLEDTVHPDTIIQLQSTLENLPAVGVVVPGAGDQLLPAAIPLGAPLVALVGLGELVAALRIEAPGPR